MARPSKSDQILDAFEGIVVAKGVSNITLDVVARAAGVSKGGLLYHFPSKAALLDGFASRMLERVERMVAAAPVDPAEVVRWYLTYEIQGDEESTYDSLVAALHATGAGVDDVINAALDRFRQPLRVLDPFVAELVRLTGDGLYFNAYLGLPGPSAEVHDRIIEELGERARSRSDA